MTYSVRRFSSLINLFCIVAFVASLFTFHLTSQEAPNLTPPELGTFDPASIEGIELQDYPILPELTEHAQVIYERGQGKRARSVDVLQSR